MSLLEALKQGSLKLREIEAKTSNPTEAATARREYISESRSVLMPRTAEFTFDPQTANTYNAENLIGGTQIPLGVTNPLRVNGDFAQGDFFIPLATTEKSLIAGISRGCKAITESGGANVWITRDSMTRAPIFEAESLAAARQFSEGLPSHLSRLQALAKQTSAHSDLIGYRIWISGRNVFLRLEFTTGDAMGMNMVTRASSAICQYLEQAFTGIRYVSVSGNVCTDKKPAAINLIEGRGKSVIAEVVLAPEVLRQTLKTDAAALADIAYRKNLVGSAIAGSFGFNAHFANVVAALYLATGQDPAHVVEGSLGLSLMEANTDGSLHASVTMPAIEVATVGGGTRLGTQQEALQLLGCAGSGDPIGSNAKKLAEIVAATTLAGELSLLAAEAGNQLADAHRITAG